MKLEAARAELLSRCDKPMGEIGFRYVKSREAYVRKFGKGLQLLSLRALEVSGVPRVEVSVAVRFDEVEATYHRVLQTPAKYTKLTNTLWIPADALSGWPLEDCHLRLCEQPDVERASERVLTFVERFAEQYWSKHESLAEASAELNTRPENLTPHCAPPARAFYGLIVARLLGKPRWDELVAEHRDATSKIDRGFHDERLDRLIVELERPQDL